MSEDKYNDFRDLEVWQRCKDIRKKFGSSVKNYPLKKNSDYLIK